MSVDRQAPFLSMLERGEARADPQLQAAIAEKLDTADLDALFAPVEDAPVHDWMSVSKAATYCGVHFDTIKRALDNNELPDNALSGRAGGSAHRIPIPALDEWNCLRAA